MVKEFHSDIVVLILLNLMELLPMALCNGNTTYICIIFLNSLLLISQFIALIFLLKKMISMR